MASPQRSSSLSCGSTADLGAHRQDQAARQTRDQCSCGLVEGKPPCRAGSGGGRPRGSADSLGGISWHRHQSREQPVSRNKALVAQADWRARLLSCQRPSVGSRCVLGCATRAWAASLTAARPNPSLKLTHCGVRRLAASGPVGYSPSAAKQRTPPRSA